MYTTHSSSCLLGGLPQCMLGYPPGVGLETLPVWAWRPSSGCGPGDLPGVGLETPPRPDPSTSPLGVGLETCKAYWDTTPLPPGDLKGMLGYHLQCMLGYHPLPPCTEFLTHATENITLPQTSFADGNNGDCLLH